jgi:hypothetical protein
MSPWRAFVRALPRSQRVHGGHSTIEVELLGDTEVPELKRSDVIARL